MTNRLDTTVDRRGLTALELVIAFLVSATAGWVLVAPVAAGYAIGGTRGELQLVATSRPLAAAIGVLLAIVTAALLSRRTDTRAARPVSLVGLSVIVGAALVSDQVQQLEWVIAQQYLSGFGAGLALGGCAVAAAGRRSSTAALAGGALAAFLLAVDITQTAAMSEGSGSTAYSLEASHGLVAAPPWWLLLPAMGFSIAGALAGRRASNAFAPQPSRAVVSGLIVVVAGLGTNAATVAHLDSWAVAVPATAVFALAVVFAAYRLDGRDGQLLLTATAVAAASAPLIAGAGMTWIGVAIVAATLAVGLVVGLRWPRATLALVLLAAISASGMVATNDLWFVDGIRYLALAPVAGYALGSATRTSAVSGVVGLSVLFVPTALSVAGQGSEADDYWGNLSPVAVLERGMMSPTPPDPRGLALVMTLVVVGMAVALRVLRARRPETEPVSAA